MQYIHTYIVDSRYYPVVLENFSFILYVYYCHLNHLFCQILVVTPNVCMYVCISVTRTVNRTRTVEHVHVSSVLLFPHSISISQPHSALPSDSLAIAFVCIRCIQRLYHPRQYCLMLLGGYFFRAPFLFNTLSP